MKSFKGYLKEEDGVAMAGLDMEFIAKAMKLTSFNLAAKDFENLKHKKEIQHLFHLNFFPKFDMSNLLDRVDENKMSALIKALRKESPSNFEHLYKYNLKGVGPGEVLLYFILNKAHLGGGSSAGLDLVDASGGYEVKAVDVSPQGYMNNFKVGGTFSMADIIRGVQDLKKAAGLGSGAEVNGAHLKEIEKKYPEEMQRYYNQYADLTYNNYFKNHKIIFMSNKKGGGYQLGDIITIKQVNRDDIVFERITSGTIKPRIKLK
jgi:hypothetical protein